MSEMSTGVCFHHNFRLCHEGGPYSYLKTRPKKVTLIATSILVISLLITLGALFSSYMSPPLPTLYHLSGPLTITLLSVGIFGTLGSASFLLTILVCRKNRDGTCSIFQKSFIFNLSPKEIEIVKNLNWWAPDMQGGMHNCYTPKEIPDKVIKAIKGNHSDLFFQNYKIYEMETEQARRICETHNLYLLYVPRCKAIKLFERAFIIQEKIKFLEGQKFDEVESLAHFFNTLFREKPKHMKELCRQLMIFIALTHFSDVKLNNLLLMEDYSAALFDIDTLSTLQGFIGGTATPGSCGLIHIFPRKWIKEYLPAIKQHLSESDYETIRLALDPPY